MEAKHYDLIDYLYVNKIAALLVLKEGRVKLELYRFGNSAADPVDVDVGC